MKVLFLSPSDMVLAWLEGSLEAINANGNLAISVFRYDRVGTPVDRPMRNFVGRNRPDIIIYTSQAAGPYVASTSTFKALRGIAPIVHLCLDAADCGFTDLLKLYRDQGCFSYTVGCDGLADGPVDWVSFHPVDPRPYNDARTMALDSRPVPLGTAGGFPYGLRKDVIDSLKQECGLYIRPREETFNSYQRYANFLMQCRIVADCALSAGGPEGSGPYARTLKTRAIETGLAGACLLELRGCALNKWATEDVDYATYETPEEAVEVARYLMANPDKAQAMAERFSKIVREKMSPRIFYEQVFTACGLSLGSPCTTPTS